MSASPILRRGVLAAIFLVLTINAAFADAAPEPYRAQSQSPHPIEPTSQAHLEAIQRALNQALNGFTSRNSGRPEDNSVTIRYGGFFQRAQDDLNKTLADVAAATAFIRAHPEANVLAAGPVPADEPKAPLLPALRTTPFYGFTFFTGAVDNLNLARGFLANNPAPDYHGSILGDMGGYRAKIMDDLGQTGADIIAGIIYDRDTHGGETGIIPLSALVPPPPDPKYGPTTQTYLQAVAQSLQQTYSLITSARTSTARGFTGDATQGGYVEKVTADFNQTMADVAQAQTYLLQHPELNPLKIGPAGPETSKAQAVAIPSYAASTGRKGTPLMAQPRLNASTLNSLNAALNLLMNPSAEDFHGFVLGDIGGFRAKIMDDIAQTAADTRAGMDVTAGVAATTAQPPPGPETSQSVAEPLPSETNLPPTAQAHLEAVQQALNQALAALHNRANPNSNFPTTPYGGNVEKTMADVDKAATDVADALAYIKAHPEINPSTDGPALDPLLTPHLPLVVNKLNRSPLVETINALNAALKVLATNTSGDDHSPVPGKIGGYRAKILDDIGQAGSDLSAGVDYYNAHTDEDGVIPIPSAAAPVADAGGRPMLPTAIAGIALSVAISLGGLRLLSRHRRAGALAQASTK